MIAWLVSGVLSLLSPGLANPLDPQTIVGGTDAEACDFPAAVAVLNGQGVQFCTAALVHPRVVMLAGHCVESQPPVSIGFGETVSTPAAQVPVASCDTHPDFQWVDQLLPMDLAYCTLQADAPPVPIVPPLMGCEAEELQPDADIILAGFGWNDELAGSGNTRKRWTVNTVQTVDTDANDLILLGVDGASACFGDSGGPAYMQLSDGTWRLVGITSEAHPDVNGQPAVCGYGVIYELVHLQMQWLEQATGYDVTPCFEPDGTWSADEACGGFPTELSSSMGWKASCGSDMLSGPSETCGEAFGDPGGSSSGGDTDTAGDTTGSITSGTGPGSTSGEDSGSSSTGFDRPDAESTTGSIDAGTDGSTGGGGASEGDSGCGCRSTDDAGAAWLLLLALGVVRQRRRPTGFPRGHGPEGSPS